MRGISVDPKKPLILLIITFFVQNLRFESLLKINHFENRKAITKSRKGSYTNV